MCIIDADLTPGVQILTRASRLLSLADGLIVVHSMLVVPLAVMALFTLAATFWMLAKALLHSGADAIAYAAHEARHAAALAALKAAATLQRRANAATAATAEGEEEEDVDALKARIASLTAQRDSARAGASSTGTPSTAAGPSQRSAATTRRGSVGSDGSAPLRPSSVVAPSPSAGPGAGGAGSRRGSVQSLAAAGLGRRRGSVAAGGLRVVKASSALGDAKRARNELGGFAPLHEARLRGRMKLHRAVAKLKAKKAAEALFANRGRKKKGVVKKLVKKKKNWNVVRSVTSAGAWARGGDEERAARKRARRRAQERKRRKSSVRRSKSKHGHGHGHRHGSKRKGLARKATLANVKEGEAAEMDTADEASASASASDSDGTGKRRSSHRSSKRHSRSQRKRKTSERRRRSTLHTNASRRASLAGRLTQFKMHMAAKAAEEKILAQATDSDEVDQRQGGGEIGGAGSDEGIAAPPQSHREALERLYSRAAPEKLVHIGKILDKFKNDTTRMYAVLEQMFPDENIERYVEIQGTGGGGV